MEMMFKFKLLLLLFIIYNISISSSQCTNTPLQKTIVKQCNHIELIIQANLYSNLSVVPFVALELDQSGGNNTLFKFKLDYGLEYNVYYGDKDCVNREMVGIRGLSISQRSPMLCTYSHSIVTIDGVDNTTTYQLNGVPITLKSDQLNELSLSTHGLNTLTYGNNCSSLFILKPNKYILPDYEFKSITFNSDSDGIIKINNGSNYQSISIKDHPEYQINNANQYTVNNLKVGNYILELQSTDCGNQSIPFEISSLQRRVSPIQFKIETGLSPSFKVNAINLIDNINDNTQFYNNSLSNPIITPLNTTSLTASYINNVTTFSQLINLTPPHNDFTPLAFKLNQSEFNYCRFNIEAVCPESYRPYITYQNQTNFETYPLPSNNIIPVVGYADKDVVFYLQLPGFPKIVYGRFNLEIPQPYIEIQDVPDQNSCLFNTTIRIPNYADFIVCELHILSDEFPEIILTPDSMGAFYNIPRTTLGGFVRYRLNDCLTERIKWFQFNNVEPSAVGFDIDIRVSEHPNCAYPVGTLSTYFSNPNINRSWRIDQLYRAGTGNTDVVVKVGSDYCYFNYTWTAPPLEQYYPKFIFTNSTCYSSAAMVTINSYIPVDNVTIDGLTLQFNDGHFYMKPGKRIVSFKFGENHPDICEGLMEVNVPAVNSNTQTSIKYTTQAVTQCYPDADGSITIQNYQNYPILYVDEPHNNGSGGVISNLGPGTHILYFSTDASVGSCLSSSYFEIGSPDVIFNYDIIQPASYAGDGIVAIDLSLRSSGQRLPVTSVTNLNMIETNIFGGLVFNSSKNETVLPLQYVYSGKCYFTNNVIQYPNVNFDISVNLISSCLTPLIEVVGNLGVGVFGNAIIDSEMTFKVDYLNSYYISISEFDISLGYFAFDLYWDTPQSVRKSYNISLTGIVQAKPEIVITPPSCQMADSIITVVNHNQFIITTNRADSQYGYSMNGNGQFKNLEPGSTLVINYIEKQTGCSGSQSIVVPLFDSVKVNQSSVQITPESCAGQMDAKLIVPSGFINSISYRLISSDSPPYIYQADNSSGDLIIHTLSSGSYKLANLQDGNPFCTKEMDINIPNGEPRFSYDMVGSCQSEPMGEINGLVSGGFGYSVEYKLLNSSDNTIIPSNSSGKYTKLAQGNYTLLATTTADKQVCNRAWSQPIKIINEHFIANLTSYNCTDTHADLVIDGSQPFLTTITEIALNGTTLDPILVSPNSTNHLLLTLPLGDYKLLFVTKKGCQYKGEVKVGCTVTPRENDDEGFPLKYKLIIGIVGGVLLAAFIVLVAALAFKKRRRRHRSTSIELENRNECD